MQQGQAEVEELPLCEGQPGGERGSINITWRHEEKSEEMEAMPPVAPVTGSPDASPTSPSPSPSPLASSVSLLRGGMFVTKHGRRGRPKTRVLWLDDGACGSSSSRSGTGGNGGKCGNGRGTGGNGGNGCGNHSGDARLCWGAAVGATNPSWITLSSVVGTIAGDARSSAVLRRSARGRQGTQRQLLTIFVSGGGGGGKKNNRRDSLDLELPSQAACGSLKACIDALVAKAKRVERAGE